MIRRAVLVCCVAVSVAVLGIIGTSFYRTILVGRFPSGKGVRAIEDHYELRFSTHPDYIVIPGVAIHNGRMLWYSRGIHDPTKPLAPMAGYGFGGFFTGSMRPVGLWFPLWPLLLLSAVYPTIVFIRGPYRRHRRRKQGACVQCGYSLAGNTSGVCPECGRTVASPPPERRDSDRSHTNEVTR